MKHTDVIARTASTPGSCPQLNGQCTEIGEHYLHWGPDNAIAAIRPASSTMSVASAQLFSAEDGTPPTEPRLAFSISGFDGDLTLAELDQLTAGLRDFLVQLQAQAVQLAAAQRQWEAQQ